MALSMRMRVYSMAKRRHTETGADSWTPCATGNRSSTTSRASETGSRSAMMVSAQRRSPTPGLSGSSAGLSLCTRALGHTPPPRASASRVAALPTRSPARPERSSSEMRICRVVVRCAPLRIQASESLAEMTPQASERSISGHDVAFWAAKSGHMSRITPSSDSPSVLPTS